MKRFLIITFLLGTGLLACTDRDDDLRAVQIRIKNVSKLIFDSVQVGESAIPFTNLAPDTYSEYQEFETAYTYAFVQIRSGDQTYTLQPIDFVGETPLPLGFYTYELKVTDTDEVILTFKID